MSIQIVKFEIIIIFGGKMEPNLEGENSELVLEKIKDQTKNVSEKMKKIGYDFDLRYAAELLEEKDEKGENLNGKSYWLEMKTDSEGVNQTRSGKFFVPEKANGELVCFYAGLPGEDTLKKEKRYVNELLKNGYTVWFGRHNGIKLNEENKNFYIGSEKVMADLQSQGKESIGGTLSREFLKDFASEPYADLMNFTRQKKINNINLIGHSFGVTSIINSIKKFEQEGNQAIISKIKKSILINGLLGDGTFSDDPEKPLAGGMRLPGGKFIEAYNSSSNKFFAIEQPVKIANSLKRIIHENHQGPMPENIQTIITATPTDAYLTLKAAEKYLNYKDKGLLIADLTGASFKPKQKGENKFFGPEFAEITPDVIKQANDAAKLEYGGSQHSEPNLTPNTLIRLIRTNITGKHEVAFSSETEKK